MQVKTPRLQVAPKARTGNVPSIESPAHTVYDLPVALTAMSSQSKSQVAGRFGSLAVEPIAVQRTDCVPGVRLDTSWHLIPPFGVWNASTLAGAADAVVGGAAVGAAVVAAVGATVGGTVVVVAAIVVVAAPVVVVVAGGLIVVVSATWLFDELLSPKLTGGTIVTVLLIVPVAVGTTAALTVNTADFPAPSVIDRLIAPVPLVDPPHESPGFTVHAQILPVWLNGGEYRTLIPVAATFHRFETVILVTTELP